MQCPAWCHSVRGDGGALRPLYHMGYLIGEGVQVFEGIARQRGSPTCWSRSRPRAGAGPDPWNKSTRVGAATRRGRGGGRCTCGGKSTSSLNARCSCRQCLRWRQGQYLDPEEANELRHVERRGISGIQVALKSSLDCGPLPGTPRRGVRYAEPECAPSARGAAQRTGRIRRSPRDSPRHAASGGIDEAAGRWNPCSSCPQRGLRSGANGLRTAHDAMGAPDRADTPLNLPVRSPGVPRRGERTRPRGVLAACGERLPVIRA